MCLPSGYPLLAFKHAADLVVVTFAFLRSCDPLVRQEVANRHKTIRTLPAASAVMPTTSCTRFRRTDVIRSLDGSCYV